MMVELEPLIFWAANPASSACLTVLESAVWNREELDHAVEHGADDGHGRWILGPEASAVPRPQAPVAYRRPGLMAPSEFGSPGGGGPTRLASYTLPNRS